MTGEDTFLPSCKIMLLDDHELFAQSLQLMLEQIIPGAQISYFKRTEDAKKELTLQNYRFLIADLMIPGSNVGEFITYCKKNVSGLSILIVSSIMDLRMVKTYIDMGADAYLSKGTNSYELKMALEKTYIGKKFISSDLSAELIAGQSVSPAEHLTNKELEVLKLVAAGHNVRNTAELLHISPYTVMAHRRNIMKKLELHTASELVGYAYRNKLI
ncbi:LuxR C-terminal-related transcriptional regulator [Dyadobacter psychrotolerans]|uniref:Response regulator transcription factor n=1 Tax=Dyadobacter psychrotolerans TaxID=2541721 RepID=A0A4R5DQ65_9BACT|nr:response regulator transcription factor [Dyadobacter psychrotolerans]TDE12933.1 response regulator transcription factor [Dyadobacter psychrotolerans]